MRRVASVLRGGVRVAKHNEWLRFELWVGEKGPAMQLHSRIVGLLWHFNCKLHRLTGKVCRDYIILTYQFVTYLQRLRRLDAIDEVQKCLEIGRAHV